MRKLQNLLPRKSLITVYNSFIRPYLDYGEIIYDQAYNASFQRKLESIQHNATLAITGGIQRTSKEKLYQELGFKSLQQRCWYRNIVIFIKYLRSNPQITFSDLYPSRNQGM